MTDDFGAGRQYFDPWMMQDSVRVCMNVRQGVENRWYACVCD